MRAVLRWNQSSRHPEVVDHGREGMGHGAAQTRRCFEHLPPSCSNTCRQRSCWTAQTVMTRSSRWCC
jgi:hypothetical protein